MGWKGTVRTIQADIRRAEKRHIQYQKIQQAERARDLVHNQDVYLEKLKSFHKIFAKKIDWDIYLKAMEPNRPINESMREASATSNYENYKPWWLVQKLGLVEWRKKSLGKSIEKAKVLDESEYKQRMTQFEYDHTEWKRNKEKAESIYSKDIIAYDLVLSSNSAFKEGQITCSSISISFVSGILNIEVDVLREEDALPSALYSVTKTGKISEKAFPKTHYNQLYQDYVCSVALATAKVLFGLFPIEKVLVHSMSEVLNTVTGNLERKPLLSVLIPRQSLDSINLNQVDPSDCMKNFNHNMNYKNSEGLKPIDQIKYPSEEAS